MFSGRELGIGGGGGFCFIDRCLIGEAGSFIWGGLRWGCIDLRGSRFRICYFYKMGINEKYMKVCIVINILSMKSKVIGKKKNKF